MIRPPDAAALLGAVADALTACEQAGMTLQLRYDAVLAREGFVFAGREGAWVARTRLASPYSPPDDDEDWGTVSEQPPEDLPPVALEPDTLPDRPLTVDQVGALLAKEIG